MSAGHLVASYFFATPFTCYYSSWVIIFHVIAVRKLRKVAWGIESVSKISRQIPKWKSHLVQLNNSHIFRKRLQRCMYQFNSYATEKWVLQRHFPIQPNEVKLATFNVTINKAP